MNYALDALWWRLVNPQLRDLASLLTAPALWQTGCELGVRTLLGDEGFRYLLDLDDDVNFRLPETVAHPLLGKYAEHLLAFWLQHAPHSRLLARNVQVFDEDNRSVGEFDLLAEMNGVVYHIELACKYFGAADGQPEKMVGLNVHDRLLNKISKLNQQLGLAQTPAGRKVLAEYGVNADAVKSVSVVRGMGFTVSGSLPAHDVYPVNAWVGKLVGDLDDDVFSGEKWFYRLPKTGFLAPARISGSLKMAAADLGDADGLIAEVVQRPDGAWHEVQRVMLRK